MEKSIIHWSLAITPYPQRRAVDAGSGACCSGGGNLVAGAPLGDQRRVPAGGLANAGAGHPHRGAWSGYAVGVVLARRLRKVNLAKAEEQREQEDPILPLERRQHRLLDRQLAALKSNLPGRKALYRLPWYLVIGLESAGKTSLIQRSGQSYTLTNVIRNQRADRNPFGFDWWIGDDGVLIDPDGELLSHSGGEGAASELQQRLWQHFIQWLERNRPQRPLNGVVIAVDLARLSVASRRSGATRRLCCGPVCGS